MVSVIGLLAITSAKVGCGVKWEPLAAAESARAEAMPIPIPAIMDLFILWFSCIPIRAVPIWRHLVITGWPDKARGAALRQLLARSKNSHPEKVSGFGDNALKVTSFRRVAGSAGATRSNSSRILQ